MTTRTRREVARRRLAPQRHRHRARRKTRETAALAAVGEVRGRRELVVARFDREVDQSFRRTSYSAIVRAAHEAAHAAAHGEEAGSAVGSEPDDQVVREGEVVDEPADTATDAESAEESPPVRRR